MSCLRLTDARPGETPEQAAGKPGALLGATLQSDAHCVVRELKEEVGYEDVKVHESSGM